jgi:NAD(P)H-hydrate epimerase
MRAADEYTIKTLGVPSLTLMERAGTALADETERAMRARGVNDVLCVCGGGNNGGDGFVCARILLQRGYEAAVLCAA